MSSYLSYIWKVRRYDVHDGVLTKIIILSHDFMRTLVSFDWSGGYLLKERIGLACPSLNKKTIEWGHICAILYGLPAILPEMRERD